MRGPRRGFRQQLDEPLAQPGDRSGVWAGKHIQGGSIVKYVGFGDRWTSVLILALALTSGWPGHGTWPLQDSFSSSIKWV